MAQSTNRCSPTTAVILLNMYLNPYRPKSSTAYGHRLHTNITHVQSRCLRMAEWCHRATQRRSPMIAQHPPPSQVIRRAFAIAESTSASSVNRGKHRPNSRAVIDKRKRYPRESKREHQFSPCRSPTMAKQRRRGLFCQRHVSAQCYEPLPQSRRAQTHQHQPRIALFSLRAARTPNPHSTKRTERLALRTPIQPPSISEISGSRCAESRYYRRHPILRWHRQQHVHMVTGNVAFFYPAFSTLRKRPEHRTQLPTDLAKELLSSAFRDEDNMVLALVFRMIQAPVLVHPDFLP